MLILASGSPRRRELLGKLGYSFQVEPSLFEESAKGLSAYETVLAFAEGKAEEVLSRFPSACVLGADTVVEEGGEILGKPKDEEDARRMLRRLSGRTHFVHTGVAILTERTRRVFAVTTEVEFYPLSEELIERYVASGLPLDKAGAYGIQDGYPLVRKIKGSFTNVVGLPTEEVDTMLKAAVGGTSC